jgi:hypothetical protein
VIKNTIKKNAETLVDASKEVGLEGNAGKSMYMLLSCGQNAGKNHNIKIVSRCFENVVQFKYLEMKVTNLNFIQEDIKKG